MYIFEIKLKNWENTYITETFDAMQTLLLLEAFVDALKNNGGKIACVKIQYIGTDLIANLEAHRPVLCSVRIDVDYNARETPEAVETHEINSVESNTALGFTCAVVGDALRRGGDLVNFKVTTNNTGETN